ncbi:hypothetical protein [Streptomyces bambusae]|uniref:DUF4345 domain-containing protein n=1 Tax=Streptomyces bambusae TaxID=1550616 RepID=A0ABS6Z429_9ACTN|nr:hypothetical protein [Streptomyces bambusae]MBW5482482.1 hypothetical protein [Streptomyces bambusae]
MTTGTTSNGEGTGPRRPRQIEAAWALTLAAVATEVLVWFLGAFVVPPTGLDELTEFSGRSTAIARLALSAGVLVVLLAGWLAVAARMRAGHAWARAVLACVGAALVLFRVGDLGMDGGMDGAGAGWWTALMALPDLLAAAAVVPMYLPGARAHHPPRRSRPAA